MIGFGVSLGRGPAERRVVDSVKGRGSGKGRRSVTSGSGASVSVGSGGDAEGHGFGYRTAPKYHKGLRCAGLAPVLGAPPTVSRAGGWVCKNRG